MHVGRDFEVNWNGNDGAHGSGIEYYDIQYRIDGGDWHNWLNNTSETSEIFYNAANSEFYEFRSRATDSAGNPESYDIADTGAFVDSVQPESGINPLPSIVKELSFNVAWSGSDGSNGSGIQYYDVQFRKDGGEWELWQSKTVATSFAFTADEDGLYQFEVRAVDHRNQAEAFENKAEASVAVDIVAPFIEPIIWLPIAQK